MKLKSNPSIATIASAVILFNFSSCGYEEGPKISLKSKNARLIGEWDVTQLAGQNLNNEIKVDMEFEKDGDLELNVEYTYTYYGQTYSYSYTYNGTWEWEDGKETLELEWGGDTYEYEVKRLTSKELWMDDEDGEEWELEKK